MATSFSPAMESTLRQLRALLDAGVEWPDAVYKSCFKSGFMSHEVEKCWDIREQETNPNAHP